MSEDETVRAVQADQLRKTAPAHLGAEAAPTDGIDFLDAWRQYLESRPNGARRRLDPAQDRTFWAGFAAKYDARTGHAGDGDAPPRVMGLLGKLVRPEDSLLDIGAGTGRFTLPLAKLVRHVTALDFSPEMLAILREKAGASGIHTITTIERGWEGADVEPHDVALAAWSLYRQVDLRAALEKMLRLARRTVVIVTGAADTPPHRPHVRRLWGADGEASVPTHLYVAGALWQMGVLADARVVYDTRRLAGASHDEIARRLAPDRATPDELAELAQALAPCITRDGDTFVYEYPAASGVVICQQRRA